MKSSEKIADDRAILAPGVKVRGSAADFSQKIDAAGISAPEAPVGDPLSIFLIGGPVLRIRINQPRISHLNFPNFLTGTKPYHSRT